MSRYDPDIQTVRPAEVVAWVVALLKGSNALAAGLGDGGMIYPHEEPPETPPRYGVVMQERPAGGSRATATGVRAVTLIVRFECPVGLSNWNAWHDEMRDRTEAVLMGEPVAVESGGPGTMQRVDENDVPMIDANGDRTRYSTCVFRATFEPAPEPA